MDGYLQDPRTMDDDLLRAWVENFQAQPPTMDLMQESLWAERVMTESGRRRKAKLDDGFEPCPKCRSLNTQVVSVGATALRCWDCDAVKLD